MDRKTVRRYVEAAVACGLERDGRDSQLTDELIGSVHERVRTHRATATGWATPGPTTTS